ncbi:hypothetical protein [Sphingomonas sp. PR090111-T3T-6A]|uniref:hypothetical protein n=1 Tax=Sphingomonas sp. PR090111-T3T-6A TaxID=685778 RepID=UPI00036AA52B|nr:hypothetical protein [Sphingomonas sp. PR090111-T3T-6A]
MKRAWIALLTALPLAACAGDYYGGPYGSGPIAYDGFYDDYYGPIHDGYWGDGGVFYYRRHQNGRFVADRSGHFRHDAGSGGPGHFHPMHGNFTPPPQRGHHRH